MKLIYEQKIGEYIERIELDGVEINQIESAIRLVKMAALKPIEVDTTADLSIPPDAPLKGH